MKIQELFEEGNPNNPGRAVLSFEVFPPKRDLPIESVYGQLSSLCALKPDFISVTYGAGGKGNDNRTAEIAARIKHNYGIESVAHLTCVSNTKEDVDRIAEELRINNIENILALRGDLPEGVERAEDFAHASDLTAYLAAKGGFDLAGACYPETHPEAANEIDDIRNLKQKVDAGASHLVTQLFFDNEVFYRFRDKAVLAGIEVPIEAGIMPVINRAQIERMVTLCGASLPAPFARLMNRFGDDPEQMRDAGIAYAIQQIIDLLAAGVDGIHLYTMNNPYVATQITEAIRGLL
ncbi:MAG: methylenetetrahydrofolate reductase [NAD(P)H] [Clostridiales bacterium]|nr:methylenetetrahydrofolate reductase [NAD(P)H] [Clostridiales bacterium]